MSKVFPLEIDTGYRTSSGQAVEIVSLKYNKALGWIGAYPGVWLSDTGQCLYQDLAHADCAPLDGFAITTRHDWRDDIPWHALHPAIQFVAMDKDGSWYAYAEAPRLSAHQWTNSGEERYYDIAALAMPAPDSDWDQACAQRPARGHTP